MCGSVEAKIASVVAVIGNLEPTANVATKYLKTDYVRTPIMFFNNHINHETLKFKKIIICKHKTNKIMNEIFEMLLIKHI